MARRHDVEGEIPVRVGKSPFSRRSSPVDRVDELVVADLPVLEQTVEMPRDICREVTRANAFPVEGTDDRLQKRGALR
jgi:hypothetical protein